MGPTVLDLLVVYHGKNTTYSYLSSGCNVEMLIRGSSPAKQT